MEKLPAAQVVRIPSPNFGYLNASTLLSIKHLNWLSVSDQQLKLFIVSSILKSKNFRKLVHSVASN